MHVSVHLLITVPPVYLRVEEGNGSAAKINPQHQLVAHSPILGLEIRISSQQPHETSTGEILTPPTCAFSLCTNLCTSALVTALFCQLHPQRQFRPCQEDERLISNWRKKARHIPWRARCPYSCVVGRKLKPSIIKRCRGRGPGVAVIKLSFKLEAGESGDDTVGSGHTDKSWVQQGPGDKFPMVHHVNIHKLSGVLARESRVVKHPGPAEARVRHVSENIGKRDFALNRKVLRSGESPTDFPLRL